jgi:hypothetical protein
MKVFVVTEGNCDCCMNVTFVGSSMDKVREYFEKTGESRYVDVTEMELDSD